MNDDPLVTITIPASLVSILLDTLRYSLRVNTSSVEDARRLLHLHDEILSQTERKASE